MAGAFDETVTTGLQCNRTAMEILADLLKAETNYRQAASIRFAFEHAFRLGEKRVSAEVVEQVFSRAIDELEPALTRNGHDAPHSPAGSGPNPPSCAASSPACSHNQLLASPRR